MIRIIRVLVLLVVIDPGGARQEVSVSLLRFFLLIFWIFPLSSQYFCFSSFLFLFREICGGKRRRKEDGKLDFVFGLLANIPVFFCCCWRLRQLVSGVACDEGVFWFCMMRRRLPIYTCARRQHGHIASALSIYIRVVYMGLLLHLFLLQAEEEKLGPDRAPTFFSLFFFSLVVIEISKFLKVGCCKFVVCVIRSLLFIISVFCCISDSCLSPASSKKHACTYIYTRIYV